MAAVQRRGHVAGDLEVLALVAADRDHLGAEGQDVRGHQQRVVEEPRVDAVVVVPAGRLVRGHRGLVGVGPAQQPERRGVGQEDGQLRDLGDVRLAVEGRAPLHETGGDQERRQGARAPSQLARVGVGVQRVQVGDEDVRVVRLGLGHGRPEHADEVPQVGIAGRLDARDENRHRGLTSVVM